MAWRNIAEKKPKHDQWVVIPWGEGFKCGQYDQKNPFGPVVIDRQSGRWCHGFEFWMPLSRPKAKPAAEPAPEW